MKNNFKLIITIIVCSLVVLLLSRLQIKQLFKENVPKNVEINLNDNNLNYNNSLSLLENLTKERHPLGSSYARNIITSYLDEIGIPYKLDTHEFDRNAYYEYQDNKMRKNLLDNLTLEGMNPNGYTDISDLFKNGLFGYNTYEEYALNIVNSMFNSNYKSYDEYMNDWIDKSFNKIATNGLVKVINIIASLESNVEGREGIVISTHYDCTPESFGASDNGMNVVSLLENIRVLKNNKFKNNIYFVFPDSEEEELWGTELLVKNDVLNNIKLVINYDNMGAGGHLTLYRSSNDYVTSKYISNIKGSNAGITNNEIFNTFIVNDSDFSNYKKKFNTIDIALYADNKNYHTENDKYENIDLSTLKEIIDNMNQTINYFGNDLDDYSKNKSIWSLEIMNGVTIQCDETIYHIIIGILYVCSIIMTIIFIKNKNLNNIIFNILFIIMASVVFFYLKSLVILFLIPVVLASVIELTIKNKEIKTYINVVIYLTILFEFGILMFKLIEVFTLGYLVLLIPILYLLNLLNLNAKRTKLKK